MSALGEHNLHYLELELLEGTYHNIGKYGFMQRGYLKANQRREYLRLLLDGKLINHLRGIDKEYHARVKMLIEQMKAGAGITEELKATV